MSHGRVSTRIQSLAQGEVAHVTIERDDKLNALSLALAVKLTDALTALHDDDRLRVVVLTGAGDRAFMGGADVQELRALTPDTGRAFIIGVHAACEAIRRCPVPVIARINGYCLGAGMEIAAACDVRIAAERAVFGMPEVQVGVPSVVEAALLPMLVGWGRARWLVMTGESIDAATAERWHFVEEVVANEDLDRAIERTVGAMARAAPGAMRIQKRLVRQWEAHRIDEAIALGIDAFEEACRGDEPRRHVDAMLAGRAR